MRITPVALTLATLAAAAQDPAAPIEAFLGAWSGHMTHAGAQEALALELEAAEGGKVRVRATLPVIRVARAPLAVAVPQVAGRTLVLGSLRLRLAEDGAALSGVMPEALVPVHAIPFTLRRVDRVEAARPAPLQAPERSPKWTFAAGSPLWAGPVVAQNTVLVGGDDGRVHALDLVSGRARWVAATGGPVRGRLTVSEGVVYVPSDDGWLHALNLGDGSRRWRVQVCAAPVVRLPFDDPKSRYDRFGSEVAASGGRLYLGTHDGAVLALEAATGRILWRFQTGDSVLAAPGLGAGRLFAGSYDGKVYALDPEHGRLLWTFDTRKPVVSTPTVVGDRVVVGSRSYDLFGLDPASGKVAWNHYLWMSWVESSPAVRDGIVYVGSSDAQLVQALDARTGVPRWRADVRGWAWGQPAVTEAGVYVGISSQVGYAPHHQVGLLALDRATGRVQWRHSLPPPAKGVYGIPGSPALGDGLVIAAGLDGNVRAFER